MDIKDFERLDQNHWKLSRDKNRLMETDARLFASEEILKSSINDGAVNQVINVASLPGIKGDSLAMPDIHFGYGFCIGGVAAFDAREGIVLPGGVGYDINCGVRLIRTNLNLKDITGFDDKLGNELLAKIPTGVGTKSFLNLSNKEFMRILQGGVGELVKSYAGEQDDLQFIESEGKLDFTDTEAVSQRALQRGRVQLGSLGAGNHFIEIEVVDEVYDENAAREYQVQKGDIVIMIHTGSRGFGHQIASDYIEKIRKKNLKNFKLKDKQLIYARIQSQEGKQYLQAMNAASNFAWGNRHMLMESLIDVFEKFFKASRRELGIKLIYDQAHNIAKIEEHTIKGKKCKLLVHRKGATRSFPPAHEKVPKVYQNAGQPVIIPGSMGTRSYLLKGASKAMQLSFGSAPHGAGRCLSRKKALQNSTGRDIRSELKKKQISVFSLSSRGLREEMPAAYKDINEVIEVTDQSGLACRVAGMKPLLVIKG